MSDQSKEQEGKKVDTTAYNAEREEDLTASALEQNEEPHLIRCICGDTNPSNPRTVIQCDRCGTWHHRICIGEPEPEDQDEVAPNKYHCELCKPENRPALLDAVHRGVNVEEERENLREVRQELADKQRVARKTEERKKLEREMEVEEERAMKARVAEAEAQRNAHERGRRKIGLRGKSEFAFMAWKLWSTGSWREL